LFSGKWGDYKFLSFILGDYKRLVACFESHKDINEDRFQVQSFQFPRNRQSYFGEDRFSHEI